MLNPVRIFALSLKIHFNIILSYTPVSQVTAWSSHLGLCSPRTGIQSFCRLHVTNCILYLISLCSSFLTSLSYVTFFFASSCLFLDYFHAANKVCCEHYLSSFPAVNNLIRYEVRLFVPRSAHKALVSIARTSTAIQNLCY